ncbi:MAG TPA: hypothetical protein VJ975_09540 [Candidatus Limnocylindria bacterium]|nr:hypothetical protein [Candidatus Limnocylindria bacterium]
MTTRPSTAERLDRAVDQLLAGAPPAVAAATAGLSAPQRPLVEAAATLRSALAASVVAPRFEARLGARLSGAATSPWILRHPGRLIVGGAVGSAVGVGVTAYAVWRTTRRAGAAHRLLHR